MKRLSAQRDRLLEAVVVVLMAVMVTDVVWQVATRFLFGKPSSFTEELARFLLIWIGLLGACIAARRNLHTGIDLLAGRLSPKAARGVRTVAALAVAIFGLFVLGLGGLRLVELSARLGQTSAALGIPLAWVYAVVPTSGLLVAWIAIDNWLEG